MTRLELFQKLKDITADWVFKVAQKVDDLKGYVSSWFSASHKNLTLDELKEVAEDWYFTKEEEIFNAQKNYKNTNSGKHLQCYPLCSTPPSDGILISPDKSDKRWSDLGVHFDLTPCSIQIHEYQDNRGNGFLVDLFIKTYDNKKHRKTFNYGPATELACDWEDITEVV